MVSQDGNWLVPASPTASKRRARGGNHSLPLLPQAVKGLPKRLGKERTKEGTSEAISQHEVLSASVSLETEGGKEN